MVVTFGFAWRVWRISGRQEAAAVVAASLLACTLEGVQMLADGLRAGFNDLFSGWRQHSGMSRSALPTASMSRAAQEADAVTLAGVAVNIGLVVFKLFAGIVGRSAALVSDAGHSMSDLLSDAVTLWAVRVGRLPPDADHPYGHGRFEALGALIISAMLMGAGYGIGCHAYDALLSLLSAMDFPPLVSR
ncbi:hypothetical protein JKP88DRAFT_204473 [Tribonema minus]|uniref:Cation efflux protein transmembrane domain-containing protein n=1 Tax=Tribonema minus TaxID=303371 RepID=A0A836CMV4_9STRA|nr:hypothetical protein JKP88DRAFT_204473 [Tribonema minus]